MGSTGSDSAIGTLVEPGRPFTMLLPARRSWRRGGPERGRGQMAALPAVLHQDSDLGSGQRDGLTMPRSPCDLDICSAIRTHPGSTAPARTPTVYYVSTLPKAQTWQCSQPITSTTSPPNSTPGPAKPSAGEPQPKPSMNYSATRSNQSLLHRTLESGAALLDDWDLDGWLEL